MHGLVHIHHGGRLLTIYSYLSADYERKVFNVSACVWNEGAEENIVTIASKDSTPGDGGSGNSTSSNRAHLGAGAIAGIVVGCVVIGLLAASALAIFILRKRRKWMKAGYGVTASKAEPNESVLEGPVFNSACPATDVSTPFSPDDISGSRSTVESSRSTADSSAVPVSIADYVDAKSTAELDGREIPSGSTQPVVQSPLVHELHGSEVGEKYKPAALDRKISAVGELPSFRERQGDEDSPPSEVSTLGGTNSDETEQSDLVSPIIPVWRGS
jgi:hypothetical protein